MYPCSGLAIGAIALRGMISTDGKAETQIEIQSLTIHE